MIATIDAAANHGDQKATASSVPTPGVETETMKEDETKNTDAVLQDAATTEHEPALGLLSLCDARPISIDSASPQGEGVRKSAETAAGGWDTSAVHATTMYEAETPPFDLKPRANASF